ncbi:MAG: TIGR00730 family Rossman fold protein [Rhodospirillaceae bacterium]|nr:TIGR00730 family Rossman fold protein [Rhodospirillaceae bacterium]
MTECSTICVFCGSSIRVDQVYRETAKEMGRIIGEARIDLVYGGGRVGLMGLVADAALSAGSRVTGIIPQFLKEREVDHPLLDELIITENMHTRKQLMYERANAFVSLPGGFGTFDETIEVLTWSQLGLLAKPIILVNVKGYWDPFVSLVRHAVDEGFTQTKHTEIMSVVDAPAGVLPLVGNQTTISPQIQI